MFATLRKFLKKRSGKDREWYVMLDSLLGILPGNIELYKLALLHRSASVFLEDGTPINNERLEFLGDAILEAVVSDFLFIEFPTRDEGFLTQVRSKIVSRISLNQLSRKIGISKHIIRNSSGNRSHMKEDIYGDALEAMIGAIYLDKGYDYANRVIINRILRRHMDLSEVVATEIDFKSRLIEWCQKSHRSISFHTAEGPDSNSSAPSFVSRVQIDNIDMGFGNGNSKKEAEQHASWVLSSLIMQDTSSDHILEMFDSGQEVSLDHLSGEQVQSRAS